MGFNFRREGDRRLTGDLSPTITAGEYVATFLEAIRTLARPPAIDCRRFQGGFLYLPEAMPELAVDVLSDLVRQQPDYQPAHRLLGIAYLCQRNLWAAVKHLQIALGLLRREAACREGLFETLRVQCEIALLRWTLMALYRKLGQREAARQLALERERHGEANAGT